MPTNLSNCTRESARYTFYVVSKLCHTTLGRRLTLTVDTIVAQGHKLYILSSIIRFIIKCRT